MLATVFFTVIIFSLVMGVLVITPVLFRRKNMTGDLFDPYYEHQCIEYIKSWWLVLIRTEESYLKQRNNAAYMASLLSLLSVLVAMAIERGHSGELKTWFNKWQQHTPGAVVQLHIMLVGWQLAHQQRPAQRQATLVQLLQRWQACNPQHNEHVAVEE